MRISRTQLVAVPSMITGAVIAVLHFLRSVGVDLPTELDAQVTELVSAGTAIVVAIYGAVMAWLRVITSSPLAKGLGGLKQFFYSET
ncbi:MAG: hypothetical protein AAF552_10850 [Pseudomonadota bacterium]